MFLHNIKITYILSFILVVFFLIPTYILDYYYINNNLTINNNTLFNPLVFFTSIFLHANLLHILMNVIALIQIGSFLENSISKKKFILLFLISGLMGSLFSFIFLYYTNLNIMVLGASGAIFGLYVYLSLIENKMKSFYINVGVFHAIIFSFNMPVAWYGHLGGIIGGVLFYWFFNKRTNTKTFQKMVFKKQI